MPRILMAALAVVLAWPLTALAQAGTAAKSSEPFKVGTFLIEKTQTTGLVLRDSLVVDLVRPMRRWRKRVRFRRGACRRTWSRSSASMRTD